MKRSASVLFLLAFTLVSLSTVLSSFVVGLLELQIAYASPYASIDVDTAYNMITNGSYPDLLVLDVRTQSEYDSGHIYGAVWIPHTELEARINELAGHENHEIIVYCKAGGRSATASGILDFYNFTKVNNMLEGMDAWQSAGYPVYVATVHNVNTTFNYDTIQAAINASQTLDGHTILVDAGTYYEHVTINKSLSLVGENRSTTIIDGNGFFDHVIEIDASNITIANLTIQKALGDPPLVTHGINIGRDSSNIVISNNTIKDNSGSGIYHERPWDISRFSNHTIVGNNILDHVGAAVLLRRSDNNTVAYNNIENGTIYLDESSNNTVNGNSINGPDHYYGIQINWGTRNFIFRNNITNTYFGIGQGGSNSTISENIVTNSQNGIVLGGTDYCTIKGNNVTGNYIGFSISSDYNIVLENNIKDNDLGVILWVGSTSPATDNIFFHNNFVNNTQQVLFEGSQTEGNFWDNGSEGNCWSDYNGTDNNGDGIGDIPYIIDENNQDDYPLMKPFGTTEYVFDITVEDNTSPVAISSNSSISEVDFSEISRQVSFKVTGPNGTIGFCNISIPKDLLWGDFSVYLDEALLVEVVDYTKTYNGTHNIFSITYNHSSHIIEITGTYAIPEYSSWIILPLFLAATLFSIIIRKKLKSTVTLKHLWLCLEIVKHF